MTEPTTLTCRRLPSPGELAGLLGVPVYSLGPIREPLGNVPGTVDFVRSGQLERLTIVVDSAARWPQRPVVVDNQWAAARRREAKRLADREAEAEQQTERVRQWRQNHYAALGRMGRRVVTASARGRRSIPAWVISSEAIDRERERRGVAEPISALTASALNLDPTVPEHLRRHASVGVCLLCEQLTHGERLCSDCAADFDVRELNLT